MSLSDRLQKARTERLIAEGALTSEHALKPEPQPKTETTVVEPPSIDPLPPITIEARPGGVHLVPDEAIELSEMAADQDASICPNCKSIGRLDMVDLVGHTMHHTCANCGTMWQVRRGADEPSAQT